MGLMIGGHEEEIQGVVINSWIKHPELRLDGGDRRPRDPARAHAWPVRSIVIHTVYGDEPIVLLKGKGPDGGEPAAWIKDQRGDKTHAGEHMLVGFDGAVACTCDLLGEASYHAESINELSIGIEICTQRARDVTTGQPVFYMWQASLDATLAICDYLTALPRASAGHGLISVARQYHSPFRNGSPVPRFAAGGSDWTGILGHRDQTSKRGAGDPGHHVFDVLAARGYEAFDVMDDADKTVWKVRQAYLNGKYGSHLTVDGVPGPGTRAVLEQAGYRGGLWQFPPSATPLPTA